MIDKRFAALGNTKELLPLKSLGFNIFDCGDFKDAENRIEKLKNEGCKLIVITEDIVENKQDSFLQILKNLPLTILVLPKYKTRKNFAKNLVKKIIKEAVGF